MAERKRKPKKAASKKNTEKTSRATTISQKTKSEVWAILALLAFVVLAMSFYTHAFGALGDAIRKVGMWLLGETAYVLPILFGVITAHRFVKGTLSPYGDRYICFLAAMAFFSCILTWRYYIAEPDYVSPLSIGALAANGADGRGGGLIGAIALPVISLCTERGAGIIFIFLFIIALILTTGSAPFHALANYLAKRREEAASREKEEPAAKPQIERPKKERVEKAAEKDEEKAVEPIDLDDIKINVPHTIEVAKKEEEAPAENIETVIFDEKGMAVKPDEKEDNSPVDVSGEMDFEHIEYTFPSIDLLDNSPMMSGEDSESEDLREQAKKLVETLKSFGVEAKVLEVSRGPSVTRFELQPGVGVKVSKIVNLADDIALNLAARGVRIEAPIPGKAAVGIEIPNRSIAGVRIREVIESVDFANFKAKTATALGKDLEGKPVIADISKMPHVLIAGATGSGKSVCINSLITSILYKADPNEVKLMMIDPKVVELQVYNGIPHLLIPVVTDARRAAGALNWAVKEMTDRYKRFAEVNVRNISGYNEYAELSGEPKMPQIIIIIDELADLMMVAPHDVEDAVCRIAQLARAAGMHLVIATQRPSVDVITGVIKANIPSRIAFAVASQVDSRTILDMGGAEKLLGKGDMLYLPMGASKPKRVQGCFIDDDEVERVVEFVKDGHDPVYNETIIEHIDKGSDEETKSDEGDYDELLPEAIRIVVEAEQASASLLQRKLKVGYSRAGRLVDQLEERGIVGPHEGSKPRAVLISRTEYYEMQMRSNDEADS